MTSQRPAREQYRPVDPEQIAEALASQPRLLAVEVIAVVTQGTTRYGCRVLDVIADAELAHDSGVAADPATGELLAVARGLQLVADVEPDARIVIRGSAELIERCGGGQELREAAAVTAIAVAH